MIQLHPMTSSIPFNKVLNRPKEKGVTLPSRLKQDTVSFNGRVSQLKDDITLLNSVLSNPYARSVPKYINRHPEKYTHPLGELEAEVDIYNDALLNYYNRLNTYSFLSKRSNDTNEFDYSMDDSFPVLARLMQWQPPESLLEKDLDKAAEIEHKTDLLQQKAFNVLQNVYSDFSPTIQKKIDALFMTSLAQTENRYLSAQMCDYFLTEGIRGDRDIDALREEAKLVKLRRTPQNLQKLLDQEEKIMAQELVNSAKYLERAIKTGVVVASDQPHKEKLMQLQCRAIRGLTAHLQFEKMSSNVSPFNPNRYFKYVEKNILNPTSQYHQKDLQTEGLKFLIEAYPLLSSNNREKTEKIALMFLNNRVDEETKLLTLDLCKLFSPGSSSFNLAESTLMDFYQTGGTSEKTLAISGLGKMRSPLVNDIIDTTLPNPQKSIEEKRSAVWAAGMVQSPKNYQHIKKTINALSSNTDIRSFHLMEMALSSLSTYAEIPTLKPEVNKTLSLMAQRNDIVGDIATALLEKLNGSETQEGFYRNNPKLNDSYLRNINKYCRNYSSLSIKEQNGIDKGIYPFQSLLSPALEDFHTLTITPDDSVTSASDNFVGKRAPNGRFNDVVLGLNTNIAIVASQVQTKEGSNIVCHEFGHKIDRMLLQGTGGAKTLKSLYQNAMLSPEKRCLSYYASTNVAEYFAVGHETFQSVIKDHESMIDTMNFSAKHAGTKLALLIKDPDFYHFLEALYPKINDMVTQRY